LQEFLELAVFDTVSKTAAKTRDAMSHVRHSNTVFVWTATITMAW